MGSIVLSIKYKKNSGIVLSSAELFSNYLYGINITANDGTSFADENLDFYIEAAQREIENYFNLRFQKQLIETETLAFNRKDYFQIFPILSTNFPVNKPMSLIGMLNKMEQTVYPQQWLTNQLTNYVQFMRRISVVPNGASTAKANADIILTGITAQLGIQRFDNIPDYWNIQYITGFDIENLPMDLINIVGMTASFGPLGIAGDLILGAGIASQSLSVDGLSQSIGSTASATNSGYGARIILYQNQIKESVKRLKLVYDEPKFVVF